MKWPLPREPSKQILDSLFLDWMSRLWRHIKGDQTWTAASLQNSWVDYGSSMGIDYVPAQFRLKSGIVYIEGLIKSGTTTPGTLLFTLPEGYRPIEVLTLATSENGAYAEIEINSSGQVSIQVGSNTALSLHCSFYAEQ